MKHNGRDSYKVKKSRLKNVTKRKIVTIQQTKKKNTTEYFILAIYN